MLTQNHIKHIELAFAQYIKELERQAATSIVRPLNLRGKVEKFPVAYQAVIDEAKETKDAIRALVKKAEAVAAAVEEFDVTKQNNPHNQYDTYENPFLSNDQASELIHLEHVALENPLPEFTGVAQSTDSLIGVDKALAEKLYPKIDEVIDNSAELRAERAAAAKEEIVDALDETVKAALDIVPEEVPVVVKKKTTKDIKETKE